MIERGSRREFAMRFFRVVGRLSHRIAETILE